MIGDDYCCLICASVDNNQTTLHRQHTRTHTHTGTGVIATNGRDKYVLNDGKVYDVLIRLVGPTFNHFCVYVTVEKDCSNQNILRAVEKILK